MKDIREGHYLWLLWKCKLIEGLIFIDMSIHMYKIVIEKSFENLREIAD